MNHSGLSGLQGSAVFSLVVAVVVGATALAAGALSLREIASAHYGMVFLAAVCASIALVALRSGLSQTASQAVGRMFVVMIVVQISVPAIYHAVMNGGVSVRSGAGFAAAFVAVLLLR